MRNLRKGFTLIELLVVIAIIGILATTLAPKLREQLAKAKDARVISALGSARTTLKMVVTDKIVRDEVTSQGAITVQYSELEAKLDEGTKDILTPPIRTGGRSGDIYPGGSKKDPGESTEKVSYDKPLTLSSSYSDKTYNGITKIQGSNSFNELNGTISLETEDYEILLSPRGGNATAGYIYSMEGKIWTRY